MGRQLSKQDLTERRFAFASTSSTFECRPCLSSGEAPCAAPRLRLRPLIGLPAERFVLAEEVVSPTGFEPVTH